MSRAEFLMPSIIPCEAIRQGSYANDSEGMDKRCKNSASFKVDGKFYCRLHAGVAALAILMKADDLALGE